MRVRFVEYPLLHQLQFLVHHVFTMVSFMLSPFWDVMDAEKRDIGDQSGQLNLHQLIDFEACRQSAFETL